MRLGSTRLGSTRLGQLVSTTAAASLLLGALVGCGSSGGDYCKELEAEQERFAEMQQDSSGLGLLAQRPLLGRLAEKAPDDLRDEWKTLLGALDAFDRTLADVGVEPEDFVDGEPPAELSPEQRTRIARAADELASIDVVEAANGIEQQAKDVCKLQLGL